MPLLRARWIQLAGLIHCMSAAGCAASQVVTLQHGELSAPLTEQCEEAASPVIDLVPTTESSPVIEEESTPSEPPSSLLREDARLQFEAAYHAGGYPWPQDAAERKARIEELERWNQGGLGPQERWHPAPRVVIGEPVVKSGKANSKALMRVLRAEHYWAVRRCYEPELRLSPSLEGRTLVQLSIGTDGVVRASQQAKDRALPDQRKHPRKMTEPAVRSCLASHFKGAKLPRPRSKAQVVFSIDVYPGDALLAAREGERSEGRIALTEVVERIQPQREKLLGCFQQATERRPGLWGRMLLRIDVSPDGVVGGVSEVESTFPDQQAVRCASAVITETSLPSPTPSGRNATIVLPLRWQASTPESSVAVDEGEP